MKLFCSVLFAALVLSSGALRAQDKAAPAGFRGACLADLKSYEEKIEGLAEAMPADKYSWRPAEGVRSVSEVFVHIAGANYLFPSFAGVKRPDDLPKNMEKTITDKAAVKEALKKSFDHIRSALMNASDADLDKPAKMFGQETTILGVYLTAATHMHEHLGQSIAYARMNSVVPPWTAAEQAAEKKK